MRQFDAFLFDRNATNKTATKQCFDSYFDNLFDSYATNNICKTRFDTYFFRFFFGRCITNRIATKQDFNRYVVICFIGIHRIILRNRNATNNMRNRHTTNNIAEQNIAKQDFIFRPFFVITL